MDKLKLYLDTTIISHLYAADSARMQETWILWEKIKNRKYEIVLSEVVFEELNKCYQPKRDRMHEYLEAIEFTTINVNDAIEEIADEIIRLGIIKPRKRNDCLHIGCAIYSNCDMVVSWNFSDMVNVETILGIRRITNLLGYENIDIFSPTNLIYKKED